MYSIKSSKGQWLVLAIVGVMVMFLVSACAVPTPPVRTGWIRICSASADVYGEVKIDGEAVATLDPEDCVRIENISYPKTYTIDVVSDHRSDRKYVVVDHSGLTVTFR